jgi:formamidopyrimidine-DNA glycosylase
VPELPEVETTRRGIEPNIVGQTIERIIIRQPRLRWPIPSRLRQILPGLTIQQITRRGKYLLLHTTTGTLIMHLGMSGSLRIVSTDTAPEKHDHVDIVFANHSILRFRDPRRFGAVLWTTDNPDTHPLLRSLGPEPLSRKFTGDYLFQRSRGRQVSIKAFIMDSKVVVGVGNIYANEALFHAGIRPTRKAGRISKKHYRDLVSAIKTVLKAAIRQGGTTLRDFTNGEGKPGYFLQSLQVYGRAGEPCKKCRGKIKQIRQGQRATYYCPHCQQ